MDIISPESWLCELESEDPLLFHGFGTNCFDNELNVEDMAAFMVNGFETSSSFTNTNTNTPPLQHDQPCPPTPNVTGFSPNSQQKEGASSSSDMDPGMMHNQEDVVASLEMRKRRRASRGPRDHMIAERMRREKISESFIALSALVPGLKKTDKTSVLGEAIKYMKQMQQRIKILEQDAAKRTVESVALVVKRPHIISDNDNDNDFNQNGDFPEIEAKFSSNNVLLKLFCANQKGGIVKILSEIEKLHLSVINVHATPFGDAAVDVTVLAQIEDFDVEPKQIVRDLRSALVQSF